MTEFDAPQSRNEALLQNILGAENELEAPMSRNEKILHAILGEDIPLEPPQSRIEELLLEIKEQGIGGNSPLKLFYKTDNFRTGFAMSDEDYEMMQLESTSPYRYITFICCEQRTNVVYRIPVNQMTSTSWTANSGGGVKLNAYVSVGAGNRLVNSLIYKFNGTQYSWENIWAEIYEISTEKD